MRILLNSALISLFLSTPSARRATSVTPYNGSMFTFLSTPSARRATRCSSSEIQFLFEFLSTPSARRATSSPLFLLLYPVISIHALREEGDGTVRRMVQNLHHFYPRPPRGGRPVPLALRGLVFCRFLSTPSARRATPEEPHVRICHCYFYPRPPRGGRLSQVIQTSGTTAISIHALREEGDLMMLCSSVSAILFLSTPSARRATSPAFCGLGSALVFLSTPSARRATSITRSIQTPLQFLSTPSARRATMSVW